MTSEQWVMILTFAAGVIALASQFLTLSEDWTRLLAFAVAVINLALATFFGRAVWSGRQARKDAEQRVNEL